jgi:hypothetical protein
MKQFAKVLLLSRRMPALPPWHSRTQKSPVFPMRLLTPPNIAPHYTQRMKEARWSLLTRKESHLGISLLQK